ncbi:hypothetical protein AB833_30320 [Chromatiales bacterium (ex Bugula neritina AB1)]|nr:hypothetical protein AB833_30320 [Chromatiales bacterium (ex Bugula neritina AB1)]
MPRNVLLLQGPVGPFFRKFASQLEDSGHSVTKVNFNGGDWYYYHSGNYVNYRSSLACWADWIRQQFIDRKIERIYLFGDCRAYHRQAVQIARKLDIEVFVFEEGYVRPNYITLEKDGVNGHTDACRKAGLLDRLQHFDANGGAANEVSISAPVKSVFLSAACSAMQYYMASSALRPFFRKYEHHRALKTFSEGLIWIKSGLRKQYYKISERSLSRKLSCGEDKFFLVTLQVHNDMQVTRHSQFGTVEEFIERVIISFVQAPGDCKLVFKHHPYDRGYKSYKNLIKQLSRTHGLKGRIHYVHDTDLPQLLQNAEGTVLINSTVGISSLYHQTPVKSMGFAIYDLPGLTYQGSLEDFWTDPGSVDKGLFNKFRQYLVETTQVNGSVYTDLEGCDGEAGLKWSPAMFKAHIAATPGVVSPAEVIDLDMHRKLDVRPIDVPVEIEGKKLVV